MVKNDQVDTDGRSVLPFKRHSILDEQGELKYSAKPPLYSVVSPLNNAKFKILAFVNVVDGCPFVVRYRVEVNIPACTIGNNAFVQNHVRSASKIALLFLKCWLSAKNCSRESVESFTLESSEIQYVTLTFLFDMKDELRAAKSIDSLLASGGALHNHSIASHVRKPVCSYGFGNDKTGYFNQRELKITAYVKRGRTPDSFSDFSSKMVEKEVYGRSSRFLRCEVTLKGAWLRKHGLAKPGAWSRRYRDPYEVAFSEVRKYFRLDDALRKRRPRPEDLNVLSGFDRRVVDLHLSGEDVRNHPDVPRLADRKYFSRVKRRIEDSLRIDISIPWSVQKSAVQGELAELLRYRNKYRPNSGLREHTFTSETAKRVIFQLKCMRPSDVA